MTVALIALLGCRQEPEKLLDTGWFTDTDPWDGRCPDRHDTTVPTAGVADWYWRDPLRVFVATARTDAYDGFVVDASGVRIPSSLVWAESGGSFQVVPDAPLAASTDFVLRVVDCEGTTEVPFRTSGLGAPMVVPLEEMRGRAFHLNIQEATWLEPGGVAPLLTLYFTDEVLIGVPLVTPAELHLTLAFATEDDDGGLEQFDGERTTTFPPSDFTGAPYFAASAPSVDLVLTGARIPVHQFAFSGTFSADGAQIGGGRVSGVGDTRFAGVLLGDDAPGTVCELAASLGVVCGECPNDGEPYCLPVSVEDVEGSWVPGFTIQAL